jgi:hypothetical protein
VNGTAFSTHGCVSQSPRYCDLIGHDGIDPNILYENRTTGGETVLMGAIEWKLIEIAELLLDCPTVHPNISNEIRAAFDLADWTRDKELLPKFIV